MNEVNIMRKVLVLEDESSIRGFIVINLRRAGYDVLEAETGEDALERLKENPDVRVALLDIMLPGIDGFEVCPASGPPTPASASSCPPPAPRRWTR